MTASDSHNKLRENDQVTKKNAIAFSPEKEKQS